MRRIVIEQNPYVGLPLICRICSGTFYGSDPVAVLYVDHKEVGYTCCECFATVAICGLVGAVTRAAFGLRHCEAALHEAQARLAAWRAEQALEILTAPGANRGLDGRASDPPAMEMTA